MYWIVRFPNYSIFLTFQFYFSLNTFGEVNYFIDYILSCSLSLKLKSLPMAKFPFCNTKPIIPDEPGSVIHYPITNTIFGHLFKPGVKNNCLV